MRLRACVPDKHIPMYDIIIQLARGLQRCGPIIVLVTLVGAFFALQKNPLPALRGGPVTCRHHAAADEDVSSLAVKWEEATRREEVKKGMSEFGKLSTLLVVFRHILSYREGSE